MALNSTTDTRRRPPPRHPPRPQRVWSSLLGRHNRIEMLLARFLEAPHQQMLSNVDVHGIGCVRTTGVYRVCRSDIQAEMKGSATSCRVRTQTLRKSTCHVLRIELGSLLTWNDAIAAPNPFKWRSLPRAGTDSSANRASGASIATCATWSLSCHVRNSAGARVTIDSQLHLAVDRDVRPGIESAVPEPPQAWL
jgi:hypothetical protein